MTGRDLGGWPQLAELEHLAEVHPKTWGRAREAAAQLARARKATLRQQAAFKETTPGPTEKLSPLEHAKTDEAIARTALHAALDDLEAGA
jgi:hypothetical protein